MICIIDKTAPNNQNRLKLFTKFVCTGLLLFFMLIIYGKRGDRLSIEWFPEILFFSVVVLIVWLYRVDNCWRFLIDGRVWDVRLSYNFFLRSSVTVNVENQHKKYLQWASKDFECPFSDQGSSYFVKINRHRGDNFFHCSIEQPSRIGTQDSDG